MEEEFNKREMQATGHFKDQDDLEKRYKDTPTQFAAIYRNANTMICPVREVMLWEDPEFASAASQGEVSNAN